jgi:hypothetical protein
MPKTSTGHRFGSADGFTDSTVLSLTGYVSPGATILAVDALNFAIEVGPAAAR